MNAKDLKKLAKACRAAGIKSYKDQHLEFTLTDDSPSTTRKSRMIKSTQNLAQSVDSAFETDTLSQDALLMWSVGTTNENQ